MVLVKDYYGFELSEGMYVNAHDSQRQGWIAEIDENDGGKIKIKIVWKDGAYLDEQSFYTTEFEPSIKWVKALTEG